MGKESEEIEKLSEVVIVVFKNKEGRMLLEQRTEEDAFKNQWTFPGGKVEVEDRLKRRDYRITAAVRESFEELSLVPIKTMFLDSFFGISKNGNVFLFHIVAVQEWIGNLKNNEPEKRKLDWLTLEEAREKMEGTPVDKAILDIISGLLLPHPTQQST